MTTTTKGAGLVPALAFPYVPVVPEHYCELCHVASIVLTPITLVPAEEVAARDKDGRRRWRTCRVVLACPRHAGGNGEPVKTPNKTMLAGTSELRPQREWLFDPTPYSKRAGRFG